MDVDQKTVTWQWATVQTLSSEALYAVLAARVDVFVVEQRCVYPELDGLDLQAMHLVGWHGSRVAACLRLLPPGLKHEDAAMGRIMTAADYRGRGLGRELVRRGLAHADARYPRIRISAQTHLEAFYRSFGFVPVSDVYFEDAIPHIQMLRQREEG